jgi:predicted enzyme related to lactoylglutathione lyase
MKQILVLVLLLNVAAISHASADQEKGATMIGSHVHLGVKDLPAAVQWLDKVWQLRPTFQDERMASVRVGQMTIILEASVADTTATIGFASLNCDDDFRAVVSRGGIAIEEPRDRPWGARAAYIQGPGALKFEIEQILPRRP